ncbi:MAG TPA: phosphate/phosphite/phosphonate ABC transporter substrate-binding protein [Streptosporangiaceae bacterium]|jgi:phosphonate transport system substrate-binding protein
MKRSAAAVLAAAGALGALGLAGCGSSQAAAGDGGLTFAAIPSEQGADAALKYDTLTKLLEKRTGEKVTFVKSTNYNAVIEGMVSGKIDVAEFGPLSYVLARHNGAKVTPVASLAPKNAPATYYSYGLVPKGSPVTSLSQFTGKTVCYVDPSSTSGYLFPTAALKGVGIDSQKDVKPVFAGGHDTSALSIKSGKCDVGFADSTMVDQILPGKGALKKGDLKVIWRSTPIPNDPLTVRDALPAGVRKKITDALVHDANKPSLVKLGICTDEASCTVTSDPTIWGTKPVTDKTFDPVRTVCAATKDKQCTGAAG